MPVRTVPKSHRNVTGAFSSTKAVGAARFESTLERDFLTLLNFNRAVRSFEVQPVRIPLSGSDRQRHYTPDVLVHFDPERMPDRKPWLCEVKYRSELRSDWKKLTPKFKAAARFAAEKGWRFKLITEAEIRTPFLENVRFLDRYSRLTPGIEDDVARLRETLTQLREATPALLLAALCKDRWNQALLLPKLWHMIGTAQVMADLTVPLTMQSSIWLPHE